MNQRTLTLGTGTHYLFFNTFDPDTGAPITLAGSPSLAAKINGGAAVTAGLTLSVDHGGITGSHRVALDVDNGTLALGNGDSIVTYIAAGTVDGVSAVGIVLSHDTLTSGVLTANEADAIRDAIGLGAADLDTQLEAIDDLLDTEIAAIDDLLDTEMPALTIAVAAIKAKTDQLAFTVAGLVDANALRIKGIALQGAGTAGDKVRPA